MNKQEYYRYLQSPHCQQMRAARLALADFMCEFRPVISEWDRKTGYTCGDRCCSSKHLEVHHRSYANLGAEEFEDLQVLCRYHHLVTQVAHMSCVYCGNAVFVCEKYGQQTAIHLVDEAIHDRGLADITLHDIALPNVCAHCLSTTGKKRK
jgi:hypothetical protein